MSAPVMPSWELRERERLEAARCPNPECGALPPNHLVGCDGQKVPAPGAERCECGFIKGSLGCRMQCGTQAGEAA